MTIPVATGSRPGIRKPSLAHRSPRLLAAGVVAADVLDAWMRRRGIGNAELAERWEVSERVVRDLRSREKPLHVAHVLALPRNARTALLALLDDAEIPAVEPSAA